MNSYKPYLLLFSGHIRLGKISAFCHVLKFSEYIFNGKMNYPLLKIERILFAGIFTQQRHKSYGFWWYTAYFWAINDSWVMKLRRLGANDQVVRVNGNCLSAFAKIMKWDFFQRLPLVHVVMLCLGNADQWVWVWNEPFGWVVGLFSKEKKWRSKKKKKKK